MPGSVNLNSKLGRAVPAYTKRSAGTLAPAARPAASRPESKTQAPASGSTQPSDVIVCGLVPPGSQRTVVPEFIVIARGVNRKGRAAVTLMTGPSSALTNAGL